MVIDTFLNHSLQLISLPFATFTTNGDVGIIGSCKRPTTQSLTKSWITWMVAGTFIVPVLGHVVRAWSEISSSLVFGSFAPALGQQKLRLAATVACNELLIAFEKETLGLLLLLLVPGETLRDIGSN